MHEHATSSRPAGRSPTVPQRTPGCAGAAAAGPLPVRAAEQALALQRSAGNAVLVRLLAVQRVADEDTGRRCPDASCGHQIQRSLVPEVLRSAGSPIEAGLRSEMEARMGADFSHVRLHTDTTARRSAAEVSARAYTSGSHIVVGSGCLDRHTLAHELTHVIQQSQGPVAGTDNGSGLSISDPSDRFEQEAEATATRVMAAPAPRAWSERRGVTDLPVALASADRQAATAAAPRPAGPAIQRTHDIADIQERLKAKEKLLVFPQEGAATLYFLNRQARALVMQQADGTRTTLQPGPDVKAALETMKDAKSVVTWDPSAIPGRQGDELTGTIAGPPPLAMEFDQTGLSFAHRSYNASAPIAAPGQRPNDHLTIENSLPALLAHTKHDPDYLPEFLAGRLGNNKRDFNEQLGWSGHGEIDNLHFRPDMATQQRAGDNNVEPTEVDQGLNLEQFLTFVDRVMTTLGLPPGLRTAIMNSVHTVRGRMLINADQLYLSTAVRRDFAKFMVLARQLTGGEVPQKLAGLSEKPAKVPEADGQEPTVAEGEADFNTLATKLVNDNWDLIRGWATSLDV